MSEQVSVIIPSYNRYEHMLRAVRSVMDQREIKAEVIVVNDGSSDERYYRPLPGVLLVHLPRNTRKLVGFASDGYVRNTGMRVARGDWIAFLDDDDGFFPEKLHHQIETMRLAKSRLSCTEGIGFTGLFHPNVTGEPFHQGTHFDTYREKYNIPVMPDKITVDTLKKHNVVLTSSVVAHRDVIREAGFFREDIRMNSRAGCAPSEYADWDMWLRLAAVEPFRFIRTPMVGYNMDPNQLY